MLVALKATTGACLWSTNKFEEFSGVGRKEVLRNCFFLSFCLALSRCFLLEAALLGALNNYVSSEG